MYLLKYIFRTFSHACALVSGACNAWLIALVNAALNSSETIGKALVFGFIALGLGKIATGFLSTGLYPPETGEIRLDGKSVTNQTREAGRYLELLHLDSKVRIEWTVLQVGSKQRQTLAL